MSDSVPGHDLDSEGEKWSEILGNEKIARYQIVLQRLAQPYRLYGDEIVHTPYPPKGIGAAAGLISTVGDLSRFDIAIDRHRFLKKETQERAWTPFISNQGRALPHGLGWFVENYKGQKLIWHYGYWPDSFSATYVKVPEKNLSFILLANSDAASAPFYYTGGIETSVFACAFLRLFLFEDPNGAPLPDLDWTKDGKDFAPKPEGLSKKDGSKNYDCSEASRAAMWKWISDRRTGILDNLHQR